MLYIFFNDIMFFYAKSDIILCARILCAYILCTHILGRTLSKPSILKFTFFTGHPLNSTDEIMNL